jgi:hypothetical protein
MYKVQTKFKRMDAQTLRELGERVSTRKQQRREDGERNLHDNRQHRPLIQYGAKQAGSGGCLTLGVDLAIDNLN